MACSHCSTGTGPVYFCNPALRPCYFLAHKTEETRQHVIDHEVRVKKKRKRSTVVSPDKPYNNGSKASVLV